MNFLTFVIFTTTVLIGMGTLLTGLYFMADKRKEKTGMFMLFIGMSLCMSICIYPLHGWGKSYWVGTGLGAIMTAYILLLVRVDIRSEIKGLWFLMGTLLVFVVVMGSYLRYVVGLPML